MARTFASGDKIVYSGIPPVAGLGTVSVVARFSATGSTSYATLFEIRDAAEQNELALVRDAAFGRLLFLARNAGAPAAPTIPFAFDGTMRSVVATFDGSRTPKVIAYVNGVGQTLGGSQPPNTTIGSGMNQFQIGRDSPYSLTGVVAEFALYNRVITAAEAAQHAAGYSCKAFPRGLIFYAPLIRDVQDIAGGLTGTITGTTVSDHPRIYA